MLDLLYIGLVVLPLTIAAAALLLLAYRGLRREKPEAPPADIRAVGRAVLETLGPDPEEPPVPAARPTLADLTAMVAERAAPAPVAPAPLPPLPPVSAAETKRCPDCAEEVLAAARVCKHCRYRFDEPDWRAAISA
jgi:hypothetical protein